MILEKWGVLMARQIRRKPGTLFLCIPREIGSSMSDTPNKPGPSIESEASIASDHREEQKLEPGLPFKTRILLFGMFLTVMVFAGLYFREKRINIQQLASAAGSIRQLSTETAQLNRWQQLAYQRQKDLRTADALVGMMADPSTLSGILKGPRGRGQVFLEPDGRMAVFAFDLPPMQAPQVYQVWTIDKAAKRTSLGLLSGELENARNLFVPSFPEDLTGIEITLEPEAAGKKPAGEVVLSAKLQ